jgi:hypothetical protein
MLTTKENERSFYDWETLMKAVGVAIAAVAAQALLVPLFAAPAADIAPRDLPVAVAGPAPAVQALTAKLPPAEFDVVTAADASAADQLIRDRAVYAAFVVTATGPELHTAPAASPAVAQLLTGAAGALTPPARVVTVVPLPADDPRGAGLAAGFLPLLLTGILAGVLLVLVVAVSRRRLLGILGYAVLSGLVGTLLLRDGLGVLSGGFWADFGAIGLVGLAVSATVAGLGSVFGRPGILAGVLTVFVVGNPLSGIATAPELLPQPWGAIGQYLPPGAGATLLRSASFFDGAGSATALWVLAAYAVGGLILTALPRVQRSATQAAPDLVPEAARGDAVRAG